MGAATQGTQEATVDERLAALEKAVAGLEERLGRAEVDPDWIRKLTGSMRGKPGFRKIVEYGRQFRESHPYLDEDAEAW